jgi:hypothetical protein
MAVSRHRPGAPRPWTRSLVYHYSDELGLTRIGNLLSGSREVIRAKATGVAPDPAKVGSANDGVLTAEAVVEVLNEIYGIPGTSPESAAA